MSPRETADQKAVRLLAEHRLAVVSMAGTTVMATCRGDGVVHRLGRDGRGWWCTCAAGPNRCSHVRALRHVIALDES